MFKLSHCVRSLLRGAVRQRKCDVGIPRCRHRGWERAGHKGRTPWGNGTAALTLWPKRKKDR